MEKLALQLGSSSSAAIQMLKMGGNHQKSCGEETRLIDSSSSNLYSRNNNNNYHRNSIQTNYTEIYSVENNDGLSRVENLIDGNDDDDDDDDLILYTENSASHRIDEWQAAWNVTNAIQVNNHFCMI